MFKSCHPDQWKAALARSFTPSRAAFGVLHPSRILSAAAIQERSDAERHVVEAIRAARVAGMPWSAIGLFVGTSGEAVRQRYRNEVA